MLDEQIKKQFKSWTAFAEFHKQNPTNFKRRIFQKLTTKNTQNEYSINKQKRLV